MSKTTIVLVDDHQLVRQGVRAVLERESVCSVVGETSDGLEAVRLVQELKPDVLVLDVSIPGLNGLAVARQVHERNPQTRVVMLSVHADESYVAEAFQHGAAGYVLKSSAAKDLVVAVREAMAGRHFLSPPLSEARLEAYRKKMGRHLDPYDTLTPREQEVIQLAAEGRTSAEIGQRLGISPRTAEVHRANLMYKLGTSNHTELVAYAIRRGLVRSSGLAR